MATFTYRGDVWQVFEHGDTFGPPAQEGHHVYLICHATDQRFSAYVSHPDPARVPVAELCAAIDREVGQLK
jgi:hypothetical protein